MKWNKLYDYPKSQRELIDDKRHYVVGEEKLPSVTTILSATMPEEKRKSLDAWKQRIGNTEAQRVVTTAANRGTSMHTILEHYITGENYLDLTDVGRNAHSMAQTIFQEGIKGKINEYFGVEAVMYYPDLYAGQTDFVAVHDGKPTIIDFKQSNRPKKREWIEDYCIQLGAYTMAHNYVYNTGIDKSIIMMCTPDNYYQEFVIQGKELQDYQHQFLRRLDDYYKLAK